MKNRSTPFKYDRILLVNNLELDNFVNRKLMTIHHFAKKIYTSSSGKDALEFLNNLISAQEHYQTYPQVIFVDINMPLMNGYQFIERLSKSFKEPGVPQPRLVVLTSSVFESDREKARMLSEDILYFIKPLTKEMLDEI